MFRRRQVYWVSLRTLRIHEFRRTLRRIRGPDHSWIAEYARLTELQQNHIRKASKAFATPILFYALLVSLGNHSSVSFSFQNITASAPSGVVTFLASASFLFVFMFLQSAFMIMAVRAKETARLNLFGFSVGSVGLLHKLDDLDIALPVAPWGSLRAVHPFAWLLTNLITLLVALFFFPILAVAYYLVGFQMAILAFPNNGFLNYTGAVFGLFSLGLAISYLVLFNIPLPYRKNVLYVRWGFLLKISEQFPHPRLEHWR